MFLKSRHCKKIFSRKFSVLKIDFSNKYIVSLIFTYLFINFANDILVLVIIFHLFNSITDKKRVYTKFVIIIFNK